MKIVTVAEMRDLEQQASAAAGISTAMLMERAGAAVAQEIRRVLQGAVHRKIVVLAGPGNNGGDGLVAARWLADWGARVRVYLLAAPGADDPNYAAVLERRVPMLDPSQSSYLSSLTESLQWAEVVLDAVLGTGRARPLEGTFKTVFEELARARLLRPELHIVAVDLPTGLDADTGATDPSCVPAHRTVTLGFPKLGLFRFPGAAYVGILTVADIGIPDASAEALPVELMTAGLIRSLLPERPLHANKGSFGRVLVVAGSENYMGASMLACRGALRAGAGLVTLAAPRTLVHTVAGSLVETTYAPLPETATGAIATRAVQELGPLLSRYDVLLVGCGLGQHPETQAFVTDLLLEGLPLPLRLVLDADALNILAEVPAWWTRLKAQAVLTPHPGEMARLAKSTVAAVQGDRVTLARNAARDWGQVVVLKGAFTVVASPEDRARVSPFAVPALASAGTGDVLAGVIAGLLAQGPSPYDAGTAGVYLHGLAGERFTVRRGDAGLLASDLLSLLPEVARDVKSSKLFARTSHEGEKVI